MTRSEFARQAFEECCSAETTVRYGSKRGAPFWNQEATMFMYVPAFQFTSVRGCRRYLYRAVDENGGVHTFEADNCCALLTPIWSELPEGMIRLSVTALLPDGSKYALAGARTFFRSSPFPEVTPPALCSYSECATKAYRFAMSQGFVQHWLKYGTPDPAYDLNVYPSKMISALVDAMLSYSRLCPEVAEDALKIAVNAADYLISITPRGDVPLADLPPTYYIDFCPDPEKYGVLTANRRAAEARVGTMMMIYPAQVGLMYLNMERATGDPKYLEEALKIASYYRDTVQPNGSWYLLRSCKTGDPLVPNYVSPLTDVVPFLTALHHRTKDEHWKVMSENAVNYILNTQLRTYNWEAQFEDTTASANYVNLTHFSAVALATYFAEFHANDPERMKTAKELMRFAEDQFVIWKRPYAIASRDTSQWHTPCALEQYFWYVPIDSSAAGIARGFLAMYQAGCGDLYLAKARALMDQMTRMQRDDGRIPTHWMNTEEAEKNFWFNCMFYTCRVLEMMAEYQDTEI